MDENVKPEDEQLNDSFMEKLNDTSSDIVPEAPRPAKKEAKKAPTVDEKKEFENKMEEMQATPKQEEEPLVVVEESTKAEEKPVEVETPKPKKKSQKKKPEVEIVNSFEHQESLKNEEKKAENGGEEEKHDVDIDDDITHRVIELNREAAVSSGKFKEYNDLAQQTIPEYLSQNYEEESEKVSDSPVEFIDSKKLEEVHNADVPSEETNENKPETIEDKERSKSAVIARLRNHDVYGGDGDQKAFKLRKSKISKIISNLDIKDTSKIDALSLANRSFADQQSMYLKSVQPALKPCYAVVPLLLSGVVITMTSFAWPEIVEICELEEKVDDLDPSSDDYIYEKNKLFIKKRRAQLDFFYNHIYSVSGFDEVPDKDYFYRHIVKWLDVQQLFFGAYCTSMQKPYPFHLTCQICGSDNVRPTLAKDLCFLLNKHININEFNHIIETGSTINNNTESKKLYEEFQKNDFVKSVNRTWRSKKPLSDTSIIFDFKIPSVYDAYDMLDELAEQFRNKPFEVTTKDGDSFTIDSTVNINRQMRELRNYMYVDSIIIPDPVTVKDENGNEKVKVGFNQYTEKSFIIDIITKLSMSDYKEFISDPNLTKMVQLMSIQHAINAGTCDNPSCKTDLGIIVTEPETLFFTTAAPDLLD